MNEKPPFNLVESFTLAPGLLSASQPDPQAEADRTTAAALLAKAGEDADRIRRTANAELDRSRAEAQQIRDETAAETERKKKRAGDLDVWAARVVIAGAVGLTASGEYSLALMVGFAPLSAWLLPLVIDVYVIQAFRRHRDIPPAIGLTIAANVIYHLAAVGLFGLTPNGQPEWWLIAVVASVASLILWRMHLMIAPPRARKVQREAADRVLASDDSAAKGDPVSVASSPTEAPVSVASSPPPTGASSTASGATSGADAGAKKTASPAAKKSPINRQKTQSAGAKKTPARRSLDEWVEVAAPVFHAEFGRLRRNPTANEFATAIKAARLGDVSDSTAKNIRAEILDRTELPSLDGES